MRKNSQDTHAIYVEHSRLFAVWFLLDYPLLVPLFSCTLLGSSLDPLFILEVLRYLRNRFPSCFPSRVGMQWSGMCTVSLHQTKS